MADELRELTGRLGAQTETLAALGAVFRLRASGQEAPGPVQDCLDDVVEALGLSEELARATQEQLANLLAPIGAVLSQAVDLITDPTRAPGWTYTDPEVLESQGRSSAFFAGVVERALVPSLPGLGESLRAPGATFLDVGVGVGRLAIEMCGAFPALSVVGIDPWDYVLGLARRNVEAAGLTERIELRQEGLEQLADEAAFDLVWLAGPFLPSRVLEGSLARVLAALRPGGWVVSGLYHGRDPLDAALGRLRTARSGGALLDADGWVALLAATGFDAASALQPEGPLPAAVAVGRRPA
jgi:SAM-dependent methyltransferase